VTLKLLAYFWRHFGKLRHGVVIRPRIARSSTRKSAQSTFRDLKHQGFPEIDRLRQKILVQVIQWAY
jgi:hypothetical protein